LVSGLLRAGFSSLRPSTGGRKCSLCHGRVSHCPLTLAIPYRAWSQCELERAVRMDGGVPWEVKVVGADIKWLVARKSCVVYQEEWMLWLSSGRRQMEVMIVVCWASSKIAPIPLELD
jgi:hypothetical protein